MAQARKDNNYIPVLLATSSTDGLTPILVYAAAATNRLLVTTTGTQEQIGHAALGSLVATVTPAGTAVQLASNACKRAIQQGLSDNTDAVQVGLSNVIATPEVSQRGIRLFPTQSLELFVENTNLIYVDAAVATDGISVLYEN